jgi:YD repeat-containing protein
MKVWGMPNTIALVSLTLTLLVVAPPAFSQNPYTPDVGNVGLPVNGAFSGGSIDTVQLNNGNVHIDIPLLHLPGIGLDTDIHLTYDSQVWNRAVGTTSVSNSVPWTLITWSRAPWQTKDPLAGYLKWGYHPLNWDCADITGNEDQGTGSSNTDIDFTSFTDGDGTAHALPVSGLLPSGPTPLCTVNGVVGGWPSKDATGDSNNGYYPVYSADQSGYRLVVNSSGNVVKFNDKHGTSYTFASQPSSSGSILPAPLVGTTELCIGGGGGGSACGSIMNPAGATNIEYLPITSVEDSDGNRIASSSNSSGMTITDTVGRAITETYSPQASRCGGTDVAYGQTIMSESIGNMPSSFGYTDPYGNPQTITVCYGVVPASLNLFCGGANGCSTAVGENNTSGSLSIVVPTSVILQNGDTYTFSYNPNGDADYMGEITSITLPTGGTISYTYGDSLTGTYSGRQVLSRTVVADGQTSTWRYNYAYNSPVEGVPNTGLATVTATDPNSNDTVFTCNNNPDSLSGVAWNAPCYMTNEVEYTGAFSSQNPIATKSTGYTLIGATPTPTSEAFTWNSSRATTETDTTWDSFTPPTSGTGSISLGNVMSKKVYDYGSGSHGTLLSNTQYTYQHQNNSAYLTPNILDRVAQTSVYNSASALAAQTTTAYDSFTNGGQSGLASSPVWTTNHDSGFASSYRGLPTSVTTCSGPSSSPCSASITTYTDYNILGQPTVSTDGRGYSTAISYSQVGNSLLTTATLPPTGNGVAHSTTTNADFNTGLKISQTDFNGNPTTYTYDPLMRVLRTQRPDGGSTTSSYPTPNQIISVVTEDAQRAATTTIALDGLGRKISKGTTSDAACGPLTVDTRYDLLGRVQSASNPHCSSTQVTDGYTTYLYDAISRLISKRNPDSSLQAWSFNGNIVDSYDETTRHWRHIYDAQDRLTKVLEPDGSANIGNTPTLETDYSYDPLGNLLQVDQWGGAFGSGSDHQRRFSYDAASRLIASYNPESTGSAGPVLSCSGATSSSWSTCYYPYDGNGNLVQKTDNRGISINYSYDALNRLLSKTYSDGTPQATFAYDTSSITPPSGTSNLVGELTLATVATGSTTLAQTSSFQYDPMGRLQYEQQCTPANCGTSTYSPNYSYDWMGKPTFEQFPSNAPNTGSTTSAGQPLALNYSYDFAERLLTASSNWADATHPATLFQASANSSRPAYGPMGLLNAAIGFNSSSGATTATIQRSYDTRGRVINGIYAAGGGAITDSSGAGSITISGNEAPVAKTAAAGSIVLSAGGLQFGSYTAEAYICPEGTCSQSSPGYQACWLDYYSGYVQVTIQSTPSFTVVANFGESDESSSDMWSSIVSQLNGSGSPVAATLNNGIALTATTTGIATNYPVTVTSFQGVPTQGPASPCS